VTTLAPPPPAPANPPPPLSPGGRTTFRITLIVAAVVLVVGAVVSLGTVAWGLSSFRVVTDSKPLPAAMRALVIDTGSVPVAVRITADRDASEPRVDLRMVNSTRAGANPLMVNSDSSETRITLSGEASTILDWSRAGELKLVLPPDLARRLTVTTDQELGVVLANADLDQLIARTADGEIVLNGSARRIEVHTDTGDVVTRDPISVSESFSATTIDGDIKVDLKDAAPRTVDASTANGDVILALPATGRYLVNANTAWEQGSTVVRVPQTNNREQAAAVVTARSETGDVVIEDLQ
jgi:Putative adhesin